MPELAPLAWTGDTLRLLDQRRLPQEERWLEYADAGAVTDAIRDMVVRGAPAIGIAAAWGATLAARAQAAAQAGTGNAWRRAWQQDLDRLAAARPTAVNLAWALARMSACADRAAQAGADVLAALEREARAIHDEDIAANRAMGRLGAALLPEAARVYTHCNAGALATGGYGTALGVVRAAHAQGRLQSVHAGETRPWLQGARLTAWELARDRIPVTLCTDSAAATLFRRGAIDWVIVGADRIAANGDVANKIGTYSLAVLARHHGVKFMVVAPWSTVDLAIADGHAIPIEERDPAEVTRLAGHPVAPAGVRAMNPAFDVTPATLVDALVTERGVLLAPGAGKLQALAGSTP